MGIGDGIISLLDPEKIDGVVIEALGAGNLPPLAAREITKLMEKGVPAEEIAFIHQANTELRKAELFGKVRSGQVRFLLGSTAKMGAGTNVQDRLIALHHLDVPWRPSDVGRILRTFKIKKNVEVTDNGKIII